MGELVGICDIIYIYDNEITPFHNVKKRKSEYFSGTMI